MDFKTHSDENGTKNHKTLDDAFSYADDNEDVERISFRLPTDENVCLDRDMDDWTYNPLDSSLALTDLEAHILSKSMPGAPLYLAQGRQENQALEPLKVRGLLEMTIVQGENDNEQNYTTTNLGIRAFQLHRA